jgi:hypothetical protein
MIGRIYSALFLLLISPTFVAADTEDLTGAHQGSVWVDPGWRRTVSRYAVTFDEQGLSTTVFEFEIQALDEKGARAISQQSFWYNSYFNELTSSELATLKAVCSPTRSPKSRKSPNGCGGRGENPGISRGQGC